MPITDFFTSLSTIEKFNNCGVLNSYLNTFADWLSERCYSKFTIRLHISNIAHFSYYLNENPQATIHTIHDYFTTFVLKHIPNCHCHWRKKRRRGKEVMYSLNRFQKYLTDCHKINFEAHFSAYSLIHKEYLHWLSENCGLKKSTIDVRSNYLKQFLEWYSHESHLKDLHGLKSYDVEQLFIKSTSRYGKSYKRSLQATLGSFFNFCYEKGHTPGNLHYCLPVIRTYQLSQVPKGIEEAEAIKLLTSIDRATESGIMMYAILQLLFTYGVRGGQIRNLKLTDINWHKEEIQFPALKGGKSSLVPLTVETGNALVEYLKNVRRKSRYQEVFLNLRAPFSPIKKSCDLSWMIRTAMISANIKSSGMGAGCFRYCFGVSFHSLTC